MWEVDESKVWFDTIGSVALDIDIIGSDVDYSLTVEGRSAYEPEILDLAKQLNSTRSEWEGRVELVLGFIIVVHLPSHPVDIVFTNGPAEYDVVPFRSVFRPRTELSRAELLAEMNTTLSWRGGGAKNAVRIAKSLFVPLARQVAPSSKLPWGFLISLIMCTLANRARKSNDPQEKASANADYSGLNLFRKFVNEASGYETLDRASPFTVAEQWSKNTDAGDAIGIVFRRWREEADDLKQLTRRDLNTHW
mmetsp:Transcript_13259/g.35310  ORF Transcript_13259/g.35310 Transcript_13259/m.35310 type:complete len:250 (+) Transcript_13259:2-751(+)